MDQCQRAGKAREKERFLQVLWVVRLDIPTRIRLSLNLPYSNVLRLPCLPLKNKSALPHPASLQAHQGLAPPLLDVTRH